MNNLSKPGRLLSPGIVFAEKKSREAIYYSYVICHLFFTWASIECQPVTSLFATKGNTQKVARYFFQLTAAGVLHQRCFFKPKNFLICYLNVKQTKKKGQQNFTIANEQQFCFNLAISLAEGEGKNRRHTLYCIPICIVKIFL